MTVSAEPRSRSLGALLEQRPGLLTLGLAVLVISAVLLPRSLAVSIFIAGLAIAAAAPQALPGVVQRPWPLPVRAAAGVGAYLVASLLWSAAPLEGAGKIAILAGLVGVLAIAAAVFAAAPERILRAIALGAIAGLAIGLTIVAADELSGHGLRRALYALLPFTRPPAKHVPVVNGEIDSVGAWLSNRSMAMITLVLWPALGLLAAVRGVRRVWPLAAVLAAIAALTIFRSQHETSMLALLIGAAAFGLAWIAPRIGLAAIATGWIVATLLVVPAASLAYRSELHLAGSMPYTAKQRIILWGFTAEQVPRRPLLGVGIASTKTLDDRRVPHETLPGQVYARRTGPHAHNIYLQTWYELGAIGALLLLALGAALLRSIAAMPRGVQPFATAAFASAATTAAFTWSLWQAWFMAAFALAILLTVLMVAHARCGTDVSAGQP